MSAPKILLTAVEPSGDAIGARLMASISSKAPDALYIGCGGADMARLGFQSLFDITPLSVIGLGDVLRAAPAALKAADLIADAVVRMKRTPRASFCAACGALREQLL